MPNLAFSGTNTGDETIATIKTKLGITTLSGTNTGDQDLSGKQDLLVSGTNIRTVNGNSLLGSTDLVIAGGVSSVNGATGAITLSLITNKAYTARSDLRSMSPAAGDAAVVDGLGLFVWLAGSTEPDDDESCFATASGCWLLEAAHWDLVDKWVLPEIAAAAAKFLTGSATCSITSIGATTSTSFTGTVTPPAQLGSTAADTGRLSYHAWVSTTNTVTVRLCNASAANAITNAAIQTAWPITVIKS